MKLYRVEITYEAVVWAEDEDEAIELYREIQSEEEADLVAIPIDPHRPVLPPGWNENCYVYHHGREDLKLGDIFDQLRKGTTRQSPGQMSLDIKPATSKPPLTRGDP